MRLAAAYAQALADGAAPISAAPDLGSELADLLVAAGFMPPLVRAFWLDDRRPTTDDRRPTTDDRRPMVAEQRTKNKEQDGWRTGCPLGEPRTENGHPQGQPRTSTRRVNPEPGTTDNGPLTTDNSLDMELPLLPWPALRPLLVDRLFAADLARCDELAAAPEIELCALALVALAYASD